MEEKDIQKNETDKRQLDKDALGFLKVDKLKRGSHALNLLLRTDDIIVGLNGNIFKGTQKTLSQELKIEKDCIITIFRKEIFFNIKAYGPLGIKMIEMGSLENQELSIKTENYLKSIDNFDNYKEFEIYRGKQNFYDILEVLDTSVLASCLPIIWFYHHRLYGPLFLILVTFLLLGSIAWWLLLSAWVILTIYMSKGAMSLLRGYCLFKEMRPYMKIFSNSIKNIQEVVRNLDKKSTYRFPYIENPTMEDSSDNKTTENKEDKAPQAI